MPFRARRTWPAPRANAASGVSGRANGRPQIHHCLRIVAGALVGRQPRGIPGQNRLGGGQRRVLIEYPRHNAFDIAIHDGFGTVERNGGNRGRGIGADPRQILQVRARVGELPQFCHGPRAFQQVARTGIVPKPGPFGHNIGIFRRGQCLHGGPTRCKAVEIRFYRGQPWFAATSPRTARHDTGPPARHWAAHATAMRGHGGHTKPAIALPSSCCHASLTHHPTEMPRPPLATRAQKDKLRQTGDNRNAAPKIRKCPRARPVGVFRQLPACWARKIRKVGE